MRQILILYTIALGFCMVSCQQEEIKVPDTGRKIVINGICTTDSLFNINLSSSLYITDSAQVEENMLKNARVLIAENDVVIDSMQYGSDGYINLGLDIYVPSNYRAKHVRPVQGHDYEIRVNSPGLPGASAPVHIPVPVAIERVDTSLVRLAGTFQAWESNVRLYCDIVFTDPPQETNYYLLYVNRRPAFSSNSSNLVFSCQDPVVEEYLNHGTMMEGVAFSDKSINGQQHVLRITLNGKDIGQPFFNDGFGDTNRKVVYFRLYQITAEYYNYIQTLNLFLENYKNPLTGPTQVFSNVEGGYGILGGAGVSVDSLVFIY
jgi:hypothetical protein